MPFVLTCQDGSRAVMRLVPGADIRAEIAKLPYHVLSWEEVSNDELPTQPPPADAVRRAAMLEDDGAARLLTVLSGAARDIDAYVDANEAGDVLKTLLKVAAAKLV